MIEFILADDNVWFRVHIRNLIDARPEYNVVGEAKDGEEACRIISKLQPFILITDLDMPKKNGFQVISEVARCSPRTK